MQATRVCEVQQGSGLIFFLCRVCTTGGEDMSEAELETFSDRYLTRMRLSVIGDLEILEREIVRREGVKKEARDMSWLGLMDARRRASQADPKLFPYERFALKAEIDRRVQERLIRIKGSRS